jgi:hypothetical protein
MKDATKDHLWGQFDKLLISALLMFAFFLLTHNLKYYIGNDSVINQTWGVVTFFLGLLSGLITGGAKQGRAGDGGNTSSVTTSTTIKTPEAPDAPKAP